jgi:tocopherol cyclase
VYSCATPHSGYHFEGQHRPWFEGWYGRVTLPSRPGSAGAADSFAMMYSIEDPLQTGTRSGVGAQVMGPGDEYIIQHSRGAVNTFWAAPHALELGATFRRTEGQAGTQGGG